MILSTPELRKKLRNHYDEFERFFIGFCKIGFREDRATFVARLKEEKGKTKKK